MVLGTHDNEYRLRTATTALQFHTLDVDSVSLASRGSNETATAGHTLPNRLPHSLPLVRSSTVRANADVSFGRAGRDTLFRTLVRSSVTIDTGMNCVPTETKNETSKSPSYSFQYDSLRYCESLSS